MLEAIIAVVLLNALGFVSAYLLQTDKLTDLLYSTSFVTLVIVLWFTSGMADGVHLVAGIMVLAWTLRLGGYLFWRIHTMGRDDRFDEMRPSFQRFLGFWLLQTISIVIIGLPLLVTSGQYAEEGYVTFAGGAIWLVGFVLEIVADAQKFRFKKDPANKGDFMRSGVWKYVRHPNYLGEILLWIGIFIAVVPLLDGSEWIAILSPVWIFVLLRYISGIPLLEEKAEKKYGDMPEYQEYLASTNRLIPKF